MNIRDIDDDYIKLKKYDRIRIIKTESAGGGNEQRSNDRRS